MVVVAVTQCERGETTPSLTVTVFSAGIAACLADIITFPLDTAKVRLQVEPIRQMIANAGCRSEADEEDSDQSDEKDNIQGESNPVTRPTSQLAVTGVNTTVYRGVAGTVKTIVTTEGATALYSGIVAGLQRQMCFASIRIGFYDVFKNKYLTLFNADNRNCPLSVRVLSGITTGGLSVCLAQPTDVVKIRMQAQGSTGQIRYNGTLAAYRQIAKLEGITGLWKGAVPNISRNAIITVGELVTYDTVKDMLLARKLMTDNIPCHFVSGFTAGFVATLIASPVDVVKTRYMNAPAGHYTGALDCALIMLKQNGPLAFYKGFVPSFLRIGSWNILMFICFEQLKWYLQSFENMQRKLQNV